MPYHHHALILFVVAIAAFYVVREFLQAAAGWGRLATRYASSTPPGSGWDRLPFLWLEWQQGGALRRTGYGRGRLMLNPWRQIWETVLPSLRVAATERGLHLRRQPWHFKQAPLLIPWKAISGIQLLDGSEMLTSHGGSLHPHVGAAIQARLELKEPEMLILVPLEAIGDGAAYLTVSAGSTPTGARLDCASSTARTVSLAMRTQ
jgi:hypothetical protein